MLDKSCLLIAVHYTIPPTLGHFYGATFLPASMSSIHRRLPHTPPQILRCTQHKAVYAAGTCPASNRILASVTSTPGVSPRPSNWSPLPWQKSPTHWQLP